MENHFALPQRQSPVGVLVMFLDTMRHYAKAFWPLLVLWVFKSDEIDKVWLGVGIAAVFIIIATIAYLRYVNFTFHLDYENEEFVINNGIFNKSKTVIQLHKIQQVNITQSLIQKIIGVYAIDVDTAGSSHKEGEIKAISHSLALALKAKLLDNSRKAAEARPTVGVPSEPTDEVLPFIKISLLSLVKVGITSNYIRSFSLLLIFFFTISENVSHVTGENIFENDKIGSYVNGNLMISAVLIGISILFLIVLAINLVRIILKYFNYKIEMQQKSLLLTFGLINIKSTIIKPEKVQVISVSRNYFQKKMDILQLKIKQATNGGKEERESAIDIPGCSPKERDQILKLLFGRIPEKGLVLKPNWRKLGFAWMLSIGLPLIGFYTFRNYNPTAGETADFLVPVYVLFVGTVQYFKYRNNRFFIHDDFLILQSGAWDVSNDIIEPKKIQGISISQLFWHKKIGIGSLTLHTAGGSIAFHLGDFETIKQHVNLWLYEMETSDSNWM